MTKEELNDLFDGPNAEKSREDIAKKIIESLEQLDNLMAALESDKEQVKKNAAKVIRKISEHAPASIYPYFEKIEQMLDSADYEVRSNAMATIANLVPVDKDKKIDEDLWKRIAGFISDTSTEVASMAMEALGKIAKHTDEYRDKIAAKLLEVEKYGKESVEKNERLKKAVEVLESFGENLDREHLKKVEEELKQGFEDAVETTKEAAEDLWNKIKTFGKKSEDKEENASVVKADEANNDAK